jgi:6-phosphogluconolactonase (cycloisomerase 2 family)
MFGALLTAMAAAAVFASTVQAHWRPVRQAAGDLVFVQTNETAGNRVAVYRVGGDGHLDAAGSYATGGLGGTAAPGNETDRLASQGSLVYDAQHELLFAVNAGSDTVSTFSVHRDRLRLESVTRSGGQFPSSIAVHGRTVYVLNAGGTGIVQGFRIAFDRLWPIPGSARSLGLANTDPPNFLAAPGQVGFTPDGRQLIVTTKTSGSTIDVFNVRPSGRLSETPVVTTSATPVPFAFTFTPAGRLAMGEAGGSFVTTYNVDSTGAVTDPKWASDGQMALCWILRVGPYYYVSNTASNTLSSFTIDGAGQPALLNGVAATTETGPIDLTSPSGTRFLYAQVGSGFVDELRVNSDGSLTKLGVVSGLPAGMEGIAST